MEIEESKSKRFIEAVNKEFKPFGVMGNNGISIRVEKFPGRKKPILWLAVDGIGCRVATFSDDDRAMLFEDFLKDFLGLEDQNEESIGDH